MKVPRFINVKNVRLSFPTFETVLAERLELNRIKVEEELRGRTVDRAGEIYGLSEAQKSKLWNCLKDGVKPKEALEIVAPGAFAAKQREREIRWEAVLASKAVYEKYAEDDLLAAGKEDYDRMHVPYTLGEACRIYVWEEHPTRPGWTYRRKPDGVITRGNFVDGSITIKGKTHYVDVTGAKMHRDINGHLRAYVKNSADYKELYPLRWAMSPADLAWDAGRYRKDGPNPQLAFYARAAGYAQQSGVSFGEAIKLRKEFEAMMSRDRVEFKLCACGEGNRASAAMRAAKEALNLERAQIDQLQRGLTLTIRCRPSQFARFLILRNDYGGTNDFKGLLPKLVKEEPSLFVDVSKNSNTVSVPDDVND